MIQKSNRLPVLILTLLAILHVQAGEKAPISDTGNEEVAMVASIKELQEAVAGAAAGTTVVLKDGSYHESCALKGKGSKGRPIVIRAETMGKVELQNQVTLEGEYLSLIGFSFKGKGGIRVKNGIGCRISRCHMSNL
jgi:hypothetical protein